MIIINVSKNVMEIFEITGFDTLFPIKKMDIDVSTYTNVSFAELLAKHVQEEKNSTALVCSNGEYSWFDIEMGA